MATVAALSSVAARIIRTAISARLAAMMVAKGGGCDDDDDDEDDVAVVVDDEALVEDVVVVVGGDTVVVVVELTAFTVANRAVDEEGMAIGAIKMR